MIVRTSPTIATEAFSVPAQLAAVVRSVPSSATSTSSSMIEAVLKDVENERVIVCPSATPDEVVKSTRWFAL